MPVWHNATKELQESGAVQVVGIIQEQHPDRCRLFMQWKQMDWPIMVDALNLLEVQAVPITLLIDEHGVVVDRPRRPNVVAEWVKQPAPEGDAPASTARTEFNTRDEMRAQSKGAYNGGFDLRMAFGNYLYMWSGDNHAHHAVLAYQQAQEKKPDDPLLHFRLGVAYRKVFDMESQEQEDFQKAIEHWQFALDSDPNQYIWRRRIQQYGPRLMKPYPFYDWVPQAREEITARGETPHKLSIEPSGAEFAMPSRSFNSDATPQENPDPLARISRDKEGFINVDTVAVPASVKPGNTVRIHVLMKPNVSSNAYWNNEAEDTIMWVDPPAGWSIDHQRHEVGNTPESAVSRENRTIEFELKIPDNTEPGEVSIPAYVLYYVCEDTNGACLYRRQDISINVTVVE